MSLALPNQYRIYLVEDSPVLLRLLLELLAGIRGALIVGHSGRADEAIAQIAECKPDAIVADLMLENGTGFDVIDAVTRQVAPPPLTVVLTNFTMSHYRERAARLGVAHFFAKSTDILKMMRLMNDLAEERRRRAGADQRQA